MIPLDDTVFSGLRIVRLRCYASPMTGLRGFRAVAYFGLLTLVPGSPGPGQAVPLSGQTAPQLTPAESARRDALIAPATLAMQKGDPAAAFKAMQPALIVFPRDARVLSLAASAAMDARLDEQALELFRRALAEHPAEPWPIRLSLLNLEARMGRWSDFDAGLAELKEAKLHGADAQLAASSGFIVDQFDVAGKPVRAVYFPGMAGPFHTLYRFILAEPPRVVTEAATQSGGTAQCEPDPHFQPYIDVESDDADQESWRKLHPVLAAKGERRYSLDTYPAACSEGLIKFYSEGEPRFEMIRADVVKALEGPKKP